MHETPLNRILLAAVILLALGEGYLMYQNVQLRSAAQFGAYANVPPNSATSTAQAAPVNAPSNILIPLSGELLGVSGNTITLTGQASSTIKIAVSNDTRIVQEGGLKDAAAYQSDLDAFHKQSDALMQDPQKNQTALETLIAPSRNVETPLTLAQLFAGDNLTVFADGQDASGAYTALRIIVAKALTQ